MQAELGNLVLTDSELKRVVAALRELSLERIESLNSFISNTNDTVARQ
jgi:hypothetical protein